MADGWRRFEQDGIPGNFFEIRLDGASYCVKLGPRGRGAREQRRARASEQAARDEVAKLIENHLARGYFEVDAGGRTVTDGQARLDVRVARDEQLEAACRAAPKDAAVHAVYADWLMEQGDPRGEIAAQLRAGKVREGVLLIAKHVELLGGVKRIPDCFDLKMRHGFVTGLTTSASSIAMFDAPLAVFADRVVVVAETGVTKRDAVEALLGLRRAGELRRLELHGAWSITVGELGQLFGGLPGLEQLRAPSSTDSVDITRAELAELAEQHPDQPLYAALDERAFRRLPRRDIAPPGADELEARCDRVRAAVARIDAWLTANATPVLATFDGPADEGAIAGMPEELRALWRIHGDQRSDRPAYFGRWPLVVHRDDCWAAHMAEPLRRVEIVERNGFMAEEVDAEWIVFGMENFSEYLVVNTATLRVAELWTKDPDSCQPVAASLAEYLEDYASALERGAYWFDEDEGRLQS